MKKLIAVLLLAGSSTAMAYDSYMGEIIGGVAGGIIGNQIGGGSGRTAATAIGAGIGAVVGGRVEDSMNYNRYGYKRNYGYNNYGYNNYGYNTYRYYPEPVVIPQQPQVIYQKCTPWVESVDAYGVITRTRTCY